MSSQIILKPLDTSTAPAIQQKYAFFDPERSIPHQILAAIKNPEQAKKAASFFNEKKEQIVGVSVSSDGYLSKVYTISPEGIKRVWGKELGKKDWFVPYQEGLFVPYIEIKPHANTKPAAPTQRPLPKGNYGNFAK
jgi:hypothetical protein